MLLHGFPDDIHLYDRLRAEARGRQRDHLRLPRLGPLRQAARPHLHLRREGEELDAVVRHFKLEQAIPVAHDASGPAAIDWSLAHPDKVAALVLLNTFYGVTPTINAPEAIRIFSDPIFKDLAEAIAARPGSSEFAVPLAGRSLHLRRAASARACSTRSGASFYPGNDPGLRRA